MNRLWNKDFGPQIRKATGLSKKEVEILKSIIDGGIIAASVVMYIIAINQ